MEHNAGQKLRNLVVNILRSCASRNPGLSCTKLNSKLLLASDSENVSKLLVLTIARLRETGKRRWNENIENVECIHQIPLLPMTRGRSLNCCQIYTPNVRKRRPAAGGHKWSEGRHWQPTRERALTEQLPVGRHRNARLLGLACFPWTCPG